MSGLSDQDRLDGASNFVIWKARTLAILDKHRIKDYALKAKAKCMIIDEVKDHVVPHIAEKNIAREMWKALTTLYQGSFVQQKILLENQRR